VVVVVALLAMTVLARSRRGMLRDPLSWPS
jgi:hypothetical protein